jgi:ATP-dependent Zn protease
MRQARRGGGDIVRGLLLAGPPGTGKRYLAQIIAAEAGVPLGYLSATSLATSRIGLGAIKVAMLYRKARRLAREHGICILLIDDINALAAQSGSASGHRSVLSELLLQIDPPTHQRGWWRTLSGLSGHADKHAAVLTIATSTHSAALDPLLLRPGSFDRRIELALPGPESRRDILEYYLSTVQHEPLPIDQIVAALAGSSPATIRRVIHETVVYAYLAGRSTITYDDISQALHTFSVPGGSPSSEQAADMPPVQVEQSPLSYQEQRRSAYYEAGRTYARLQYGAPGSLQTVYELAIGGHTEACRHYSRDELLRAIQVLLAGRAAEERLLHIRSALAADDLARATQLAALVVGAFGMDRELFSYRAGGDETLQADMPFGDFHHRIENVLQEQFGKARDIITHNHTAVTMLAEALLLRPDLSDDAVRALLARAQEFAPSAPATESARAAPFLVARRYRAPAEKVSPSPHHNAITEELVPPQVEPEPQEHPPQSTENDRDAEPESEPRQQE